MDKYWSDLNPDGIKVGQYWLINAITGKLEGKPLKWCMWCGFEL